MAVALVVLQVLLVLKRKTGAKALNNLGIGAVCVFSGVLVYISLQTLVDHLSEQSSANFRRSALNILLVQNALVEGRVELSGLDDNPSLFKAPAGKAFLALFPIMAVSIERLDEKIHDAKLELIARAISKKIGGPEKFYKKAYAEAVNRAREKWKQYSRVPSASAIESTIAKQQDIEWGKYVTDLAKRGWTPSSIPAYARSSVVSAVRKKIPVPVDWMPFDEAAFKAAIAAEVRKKIPTTSDGSVSVGTRRIPAGLSWSAFFSNTVVQEEIRSKLNLPAGVNVRPAYDRGLDFDIEVYRPMVRSLAAKEIARYDAKATMFEKGGPYEKAGINAARAVIVPPIGLFFSLFGAIGHLAKLSYLILAMALRSLPAQSFWINKLWVAPLAVLFISWMLLSVVDNEVTKSHLYQYLTEQIGNNGSIEGLHSLGSGLIRNALHVIAVGQGYGYPVNEFIRTNVLMGITYGYDQ